MLSLSHIANKLIQEVVNVQSKGRKHYIATEFEPSKELTGGAWYSEGKLDKDYINLVKDQFAKMIYQHKVATLEGIADAIRKTKIFKTEFTKQQTEEIVRDLVLDNRVVEVKSTGMAEFASIQIGKVCYKCKSKVGAMASIPCGVCPRISQCTPDGIISPSTCVYFAKWLDF
ncbi:hypothetical protein PS2_044095 [Malus domestica]|nr:DNA-directed RNA polymerase III subunit rpc6-like [Malus domestica]